MKFRHLICAVLLVTATILYLVSSDRWLGAILENKCLLCPPYGNDIHPSCLEWCLSWCDTMNNWVYPSGLLRKSRSRMIVLSGFACANVRLEDVLLDVAVSDYRRLEQAIAKLLESEALWRFQLARDISIQMTFLSILMGKDIMRTRI